MNQQWQHETHIEYLEEQLRRMEEMLRHTQKLATLGQLSASIIHELRNQLTSILGHLELASQHQLPIQVAADLQTAQLETKRTCDILSNILAFARKDTRRIPETSTDINQVVRRALHLCMYRLQTRNIRIALDLDPDVPSIQVNPILLQQAFVNLIINCEQALTAEHEQRPQPAEIRISSRSEPATIILQIEDNGPGIEPAIRDRIFEPFVTTKPNGTGLGLKIVQDIIQAHGGSLTVESVVGQGTSVAVRLPQTP